MLMQNSGTGPAATSLACGDASINHVLKEFCISLIIDCRAGEDGSKALPEAVSPGRVGTAELHRCTHTVAQSAACFSLTLWPSTGRQDA